MHCVDNSVIRYPTGALHLLLLYICGVCMKIMHSGLISTSAMLLVSPKTIKDGTPITSLKFLLLKELFLSVYIIQLLTHVLINIVVLRKLQLFSVW